VVRAAITLRRAAPLGDPLEYVVKGYHSPAEARGGHHHRRGAGHARPSVMVAEPESGSMSGHLTLALPQPQRGKTSIFNASPLAPARRQLAGQEVASTRARPPSRRRGAS